MMVLAKLLASTHVSSLIKSKGSKKSQLITLTPESTIRTALMTFVEQDISAIPIRTDGSEFEGMLNIVDILGYILKGSFESFYKQDIQTLLSRPISLIIKECGIKRIKIINEQLSLIQLLFDHWGKFHQLYDSDIDMKHLLVCCAGGKYDVVTPTDLLRYVLLLSRESGYLRNTKASQISCCFDVNHTGTVNWEEDAWKAFNHLLENRPFFVLGIVDGETGKLEANLSATDFLPLSLNSNSPSISLEDAISMLRRPGLSLYTFVRTTKRLSMQNDLDPICIQPHFSLADLIEKMAQMKIHHLWRVSQDRTRTPIGFVGICDVIAHFCKVFESFYKDSSMED